MTRPKTERRLPDYLPMDDIRRLIAAAYRLRPDNGLLLEVLFWTGARVSEAARLRVEHLGLGENEIKIVAGKLDKDRCTFLPASVAEKLRLHVGARRNGPVFTSRLGRAFSVRRVEQLVKLAARRAGITRIRVSPHCLRRSLGTHLLNQGVPLEAVADLLGHADVKVTRDHYATLALPTLRKLYFEAVGRSQSGNLRA